MTDHILVLGAGAAGLGAARVLADQGASVTVIEARSHIGGRAYTSTAWPDLPVDMGASWIHGITGNPLTKIATHLGLTLYPTSFDRQILFDAADGWVNMDTAEKDAMRIVEAARDAVDGRAADMSVATALSQFPEWRALPPKLRRAMRTLLHTRIEHDYGGDLARLSARHYDDDIDLPGTDVLMGTGYAPIMAHLAKGLDIRLGEPALRLKPNPQGVTLITSRRSYHASKVIVTLPLGVLKSGDVQFDAPLEKKRQQAIDQLEMGLLNKCWLRFDHAFWPEDIDWIDYIGTWPGEAPGPFPEFTNFSRQSGVPLLVGFNGAAPAETLEKFDDATTVATAMDALRRMFGNKVPDPIGTQISRWKIDPFSRGAYSFQPVGTTADTRQNLFGHDWEDRLLFAGEATSHRHPGTVHGALITGRTAAKMI